MKQVIIICCAFLVILVLVFNCVITVRDEYFPAQQQKWNKRAFEENPDENGQCIVCKRYFPNKEITDGKCDEKCGKREYEEVVYEK